jgi:hypothetical protein
VGWQGSRSQRVEAAARPAQAMHREGEEADRRGPQSSDMGETAPRAECVT